MRISRQMVGFLMITAVLSAALATIMFASLPVDVHAVCDPLVNMTRQQVNSVCVCSQNIAWP